MSKSVNLQVNAGPHFALGLGGKYKEEWNETYEGVTESGSDDIPFFGKSKDDKEKFGAKRFDLGLSFGAGVTIKKHVYIGIQYDLGLMNMAIHDEEGGWSDKTKFHNRNFAIQLGYNFYPCRRPAKGTLREASLSFSRPNGHSRISTDESP